MLKNNTLTILNNFKGYREKPNYKFINTSYEYQIQQLISRLVKKKADRSDFLINDI